MSHVSASIKRKMTTRKDNDYRFASKKKKNEIEIIAHFWHGEIAMILLYTIHKRATTSRSPFEKTTLFAFHLENISPYGAC